MMNKQQMVAPPSSNAKELVSEAEANKTSEGKAPYGYRPDGTPKGEGWLGKIPMQDGSHDFMTEQTAEMDVDGKRVQFPLIHPGSTKEEIEALAKGQELSRESTIKALDFALQRMKDGKSPYKD